MSTSPHAPQAAGACHWTASQDQGPHTGKGSLLTSVKTLVSISRAPVFLWTLEGVSPQPEIQEWGTSRVARYRQRNCSCKRQKQWRWQHECKLHSCLLCFFWRSSLHMFQYHAKKSPNNALSNHWIYVLREERRKTHEWYWIHGNTLLMPLAQEVLESQTICRRLWERVFKIPICPVLHWAPALGLTRRKDTQRDGPLVWPRRLILVFLKKRKTLW